MLPHPISQLKKNQFSVLHETRRTMRVLSILSICTTKLYKPKMAPPQPSLLSSSSRWFQTDVKDGDSIIIRVNELKLDLTNSSILYEMC